MAKEEVHGKGPSEKGEKDGRKKEDVSEDTCRCKEVSKKTVPDMLRLMVSDLAFWRRAGKRR